MENISLMIEYLSLKRITAMHEDEINKAISDVVASGWYLNGTAVQRFEEHYRTYIGTQHCISCGNGLDALHLILRAYKELGQLHDGDEIIVPANTYIATILAITENNLTPVLVEPDITTLEIDDNRIETAITPLQSGSKFRCKIVVHNLLPIEIGALLSAITFHQNDLCYHSIGMAKPLGYGKIKLSVLDLNGFSKEVKEYLKDFESAMNGEIFDGKIKWHESEQIKNLFSMASEQDNEGNSELVYMNLEDFAKSKNSDRRYYLDRYIKLTNINTMQAVPLSDQQSILSYQKFANDLIEKEKALKEEIELRRKEKELQEATSNMSELDKRIYKLKNDPIYKNMPEATVLFKAISQTDKFDDMKFEALCGLRDMFKKIGRWKEQTKQKRPEKDRDYQDTLKIMEMLKEFKK